MIAHLENPPLSSQLGQLHSTVSIGAQVGSLTGSEEFLGNRFVGFSTTLFAKWDKVRVTVVATISDGMNRFRRCPA